MQIWQSYMQSTTRSMSNQSVQNSSIVYLILWKDAGILNCSAMEPDSVKFTSRFLVDCTGSYGKHEQHHLVVWIYRSRYMYGLSVLHIEFKSYITIS